MSSSNVFGGSELPSFSNASRSSFFMTFVFSTALAPGIELAPAGFTANTNKHVHHMSMIQSQRIWTDHDICVWKQWHSGSSQRPFEPLNAYFVMRRWNDMQIWWKWVAMNTNSIETFIMRMYYSKNLPCVNATVRQLNWTNCENLSRKHVTCVLVYAESTLPRYDCLQTEFC